MAIEVTDANFEELVLKSDKPVYVDFWAAWCGPCRMIHPIMDEISNEYEGKAIVAKVDVDHHQKYAAEYGIRNIPTVLLIKNGEIFHKQVGVAPKSLYVEKLEEALR
jgi:thioredoxin 1